MDPFLKIVLVRTDAVEVQVGPVIWLLPDDHAIDSTPQSGDPVPGVDEAFAWMRYYLPSPQPPI